MSEVNAFGQYVQVLKGQGRVLITFNIKDGSVVSQEPLEKDRVTGDWGRMVEGKFKSVGNETKVIFQQPGTEAPGGYSWQERKDIR